MKHECVTLDMKQKAPHEKGFSLIELAVVVTIVIIISVVAATNLFSRRNQLSLNSVTQQIATTLREAQSRSVAQESNSVWGVKFVNVTTTAPYYELLQSGVTVSHHRLPTGIQYSTSSIEQGQDFVVNFAQVSGFPFPSTVIRLNLTPGAPGAVNAPSAIPVATSGLISF